MSSLRKAVHISNDYEYNITCKSLPSSINHQQRSQHIQTHHTNSKSDIVKPKSSIQTEQTFLRRNQPQSMKNSRVAKWYHAWNVRLLARDSPEGSINWVKEELGGIENGKCFRREPWYQREVERHPDKCLESVMKQVVRDSFKDLFSGKHLA